MSTTPLDTNFKDDILASSNAKRKYQMTYNDDGTVSFQDVTAYSQMGSAFGAKEVNEERTAINKINSDRIVALDEIDLVTEPGFFVDAMAVKELNRNLQSGYTHLSQTTNGCVEFENGLKVVYGSYNAGFMSRDSTTDGYSITIDISQYGLNNPLFALASARYDQGHPLATVHSTSVDAIKIGCNVNYDGCFIMWFVIG